MAEEKKKTTRRKKTTNRVTLDKNELSEIITNALLEYDKKKEEKKNAEVKAQVQSNQVEKVSTFKAILNPKKYVNEEGSNVAVLKSLIKGFYKILQWIFIAISVILIAYIPLQYIDPTLTPVAWYFSVLYGFVAVLSFLISRVIIMMSLEIDRSKDTNMLLGIFSSIVAIISIVIAIVK